MGHAGPCTVHHLCLSRAPGTLLTFQEEIVYIGCPGSQAGNIFSEWGIGAGLGGIKVEHVCQLVPLDERTCSGIFTSVGSYEVMSPRPLPWFLHNAIKTKR